jgi:hypothetical protein
MYDGGPMDRIPADREEGKAREDELRKDYRRSQKKEARMAIFGFGSKKDTRPVDVGLASLAGKSEGEAVEFWKARLVQIAQIPSEIARVGALTPQLRELSRIDGLEERKRLTRARILAFAQLSSDQQQLIATARAKAWSVDQGVMDADQKLVDEILPTVDESVRRVYPRRA